MIFDRRFGLRRGCRRRLEYGAKSIMVMATIGVLRARVRAAEWLARYGIGGLRHDRSQEAAGKHQADDLSVAPLLAEAISGRIRMRV